MSIPESFESEESLYDWLMQRGLSLRRPSSVLRQRPSMPNMPEIYQGPITRYPYVIQAPEPDPNFVWVGNRDDFSGNWHRIGDPITPEKVGLSTYNSIGKDQTFGQQHHNINLPGESNLTQEQLQDKLRGLNLPYEGDRSSLFKRIVNVQESPELMGRLQEGGRPTELELGDIVKAHEPIDLNQAARLRQLRAGGENIPEQPQGNWWQQNNLNPANWRSQANPVRADGSPVSNVEANQMRQWGQQNLMNRANALQQMGRTGTGANPMSINNLPGAQVNALRAGGSAAAGEAGMLGSAATFASRALPIMNLVMLGGMMLKGMNAGREADKQQQKELMMRT
jgi:hypothetical protein